MNLKNTKKMKTKTLMVATIIATSFALTSCGGSEEVEETTSNETTEEVVEEAEKTVNVNLEESKVHWKGEMLGVYSHEGNIKLKEGSFTMKGDKVTGGNFVVDMSTMTPTDENYNPKEGKTPEQLVGHLQSPDFFDVANHPTASFVVNSVDGNVATGKLTVRGKEGEEKVENVNVAVDGNNVTITGTLTFNRQNYGVSYMPKMQDMVLSNDIIINVEIKGTI